MSQGAIAAIEQRQQQNLTGDSALLVWIHPHGRTAPEVVMNRYDSVSRSSPGPGRSRLVRVESATGAAENDLEHREVVCRASSPVRSARSTTR